MINIDFKKISNSKKMKKFFIIFCIVFILVPAFFVDILLFMFFSQDDTHTAIYSAPYRKDENLGYILKKDENGMYYLEYSTKSSYFYYDKELSTQLVGTALYGLTRSLLSCEKGNEKIHGNRFEILNSKVELEPFINKQVNVTEENGSWFWSPPFPFSDGKKQCIQDKCKERFIDLNKDDLYRKKFIDIISISLAK